MSARPLALRAGRAEKRPDGLAVHLPDLARTELLAPLAAAVWQAADGQTSLEGLLAAARTVEPNADLNRLWLVLDVLADADLLAQRLAPPGPDLDRRGWLRTVASVAAAAAVAAVTLQAPGAHAKKVKVDPARDSASEENTKAQRKKGDGKADEHKQKDVVRAERAERRQADERKVKLRQSERADERKVREETAKKDRTAVRADAEQNREQSAKQANPGRRQEASRKGASESQNKAAAAPGSAEAQPAAAAASAADSAP